MNTHTLTYLHHLQVKFCQIICALLTFNIEKNNFKYKKKKRLEWTFTIIRHTRSVKYTFIQIPRLTCTTPPTLRTNWPRTFNTTRQAQTIIRIHNSYIRIAHAATDMQRNHYVYIRRHYCVGLRMYVYLMQLNFYE